MESPTSVFPEIMDVVPDPSRTVSKDGAAGSHFFGRAMVLKIDDRNSQAEEGLTISGGVEEDCPDPGGAIRQAKPPCPGFLLEHDLPPQTASPQTAGHERTFTLQKPCSLRQQ